MATVWRLARSLETLRSQVNSAYPTRNKAFKETNFGCWEYQGYRNEDGYGQIRVGRGRLQRVHRVIYEYFIQELGEREVVRHLCDNPPCSNPGHLLAGTQRENIQEMWQKGRSDRSNWTQCPKGHKYPESRPKGISKNRCRPCANERNRRYKAKIRSKHDLAAC